MKYYLLAIVLLTLHGSNHASKLRSDGSSESDSKSAIEEACDEIKDCLDEVDSLLSEYAELTTSLDPVRRELNGFIGAQCGGGEPTTTETPVKRKQGGIRRHPTSESSVERGMEKSIMQILRGYLGF